MLWFRSLVFSVAFYGALAAMMLLSLPILALPRKSAFEHGRLWCRVLTWLTHRIAGIRSDIRGLEKLPAGPLLIASKHQSLWETFALIPHVPDPAYILKRELMWIPVFGWYCAKFGMIPVERGARSIALAAVVERSREAMQAGRQILIFPEGTRKPPGAEPAYKYGIMRLYAELGVPCVPVALNSGLFWPRRKMIRYPGTIVAEIQEPIPPGLDAETFSALLSERLEGGTARLLREAAESASPPPLPAALRALLDPAKDAPAAEQPQLPL